MSNSIEGQAVNVLIEACNKGRESGEPFKCTRKHQNEVAALSRAGLLVSERDVLCRKLAEECVEHGSMSNQFVKAFSALYAYDREHAPKPTWVVSCRGVNDAEPYCVKRHNEPRYYFAGSEQQCNAVAAALNALAEKEAGR